MHLLRILSFNNQNKLYLIEEKMESSCIEYTSFPHPIVQLYVTEENKLSALFKIILIVSQTNEERELLNNSSFIGSILNWSVLSTSLLSAL